jgi:hypothetical protein
MSFLIALKCSGNPGESLAASHDSATKLSNSGLRKVEGVRRGDLPHARRASR